jgi:hypothetical protein
VAQLLSLVVLRSLDHLNDAHGKLEGGFPSILG